MAEGIVDVLEPVEIDEQHADAMSAALGLAIACVRRSCSSSRLGKPVSASRAPGTAAVPRPVSATRRPARTTGSRRSGLRRPAPSDTTRTRSFAVAAVIAREAGRPRLFATMRRPRDPRRPRGLPRARAGCRRAESRESRRTPAEDVFRLRRPANQPEITVPLEHRQRRVADVRRQHPVDALQFVFVAFLVVDIRVHRVDSDHVPFGVAIRRKVNRFRALRHPVA